MRLVLRFRAPRGVPGGYVGASLAAHVVAAAALLLLPMLRPRPPLIPVDATMVELAGPLPAPSRGGAGVVSAPAPPKPAPKAVEKPVERAPAPEKLVLAKPSKKKEPEKKKQPEPAEAAEGPAAPAPASPGPSAPAAGGAGVTALEGGGVPGAGWYNAAVTSALQGAWIRPVLDASDQAYSVVVSFDIGRDGSVFNLAVDVPSGVPALDRSALRAVTDAAPFPAPPASAGGSIRQRIRFELTPE